jgi:formate-dependent nitrite reductase membrane component NrfD
MARHNVVETTDPSDPFNRLTPAYEIAKTAAPDRVQEPGYYGLPILKRPFWKWEIALYFFSEGISAGSYLLGTVADLVGKGQYAEIVSSGRYLSFLFMLPCPPLLIADLGRPERFHHMLRIFKRSSPMNHGAWALSGYGAFSAALAAFEPGTTQLPFAGRMFKALQTLIPIPRKIVSILGAPFALTMVSYPGVLLSTTSNPVWSHTHFLGSLFAASSMSTAVSALTLSTYQSGSDEAHRVLTRFEDLAAAVETVALGAYLGTSRRAAKPLTRGKQSKLFLCGAVLTGLVLPAILRRSENKILRCGVAPLLTLAGGLALKWSVTYAGQESALDAELAVHNSPTKTGEPFWGPRQTSPRSAHG